MDTWLREVRDRLAEGGFVLTEDVSFDGTTFPLLARRTRFELTKFGFSETFFVFADFDRLTTEAYRAFSADAFRCAKQHRAIALPCGLFESVWCYAVALAGEVGGPTLASIRKDTPPRHWASAEIPVVYDRGRGELAYFEETPIWGSAYYAGFRREIRRWLAGGRA